MPDLRFFLLKMSELIIYAASENSKSFLQISGIKIRSEFFKLALLYRGAYFFHKLIVKIEVMHCAVTHAEQLARGEKMTQIRP